MSLNDRQHVEAMAIIRALVQATPTEQLGDAHRAAAQWLEENHPEPAVYMNALRQAEAHREAPEPIKGCTDDSIPNHDYNCEACKAENDVPS